MILGLKIIVIQIRLLYATEPCQKFIMDFNMLNVNDMYEMEKIFFGFWIFKFRVILQIILSNGWVKMSTF